MTLEIRTVPVVEFIANIVIDFYPRILGIFIFMISYCKNRKSEQSLQLKITELRCEIDIVELEIRKLQQTTSVQNYNNSGSDNKNGFTIEELEAKKINLKIEIKNIEIQILRNRRKNINYFVTENGFPDIGILIPIFILPIILIIFYGLYR